MDVRERNLPHHDDAAVGAPRHPWETARFAFLVRLINAHRAVDSSRRLIVDFGAGDLFVARSLAQRFPAASIMAIDLAYGRESGITDTLLSPEEKKRITTVTEFHGRPKQPTLLLMLDVIEHLEDPSPLVNELITAMPDSIVIVTVPAFQRLFGAHDRFLHHFRRYSKKQLEAELCAGGLEIIESGYFFLCLLPLRVLANIFGRQSRTQQGVGGVRTRPLADALIHWALFIDAVVCRMARKAGITLPGLSCYAVCKPW